MALGFDSEMETFDAATSEKEYALPDGQVITIGNERFRAAEPLFTPAFIGRETSGIGKVLHESIMKCDKEIREKKYENVILSGGSKMFPGFAVRMKRELEEWTNEDVTVNVIAPPERDISAWIGGSILASLSTFREMWITKDEYDENGPAIVHRKCF